MKAARHPRGDSLSLTRLVVLGAIGVAVGFGAATLVEQTGWNPLIAPLITIVGAGVVAFALRDSELLSFLIEGGFFVYCAYIGMSIVRAVGGHNYLAAQYGSVLHYGSPQLLDGINIVVLAVGLAYAFGITLVVALPVWSLMQRAPDKLPRDEKFWEFIDQQNGIAR